MAVKGGDLDNLVYEDLQIFKDKCYGEFWYNSDYLYLDQYLWGQATQKIFDTG